MNDDINLEQSIISLMNLRDILTNIKISSYFTSDDIDIIKNSIKFLDYIIHKKSMYIYLKNKNPSNCIGNIPKELLIEQIINKLPNHYSIEESFILLMKNITDISKNDKENRIINWINMYFPFIRNKIYNKNKDIKKEKNE